MQCRPHLSFRRPAIDANPPRYTVFNLQSPPLTHGSLDELCLPICIIEAVGGNRGDVI